jgi:hypothetical protein
MCQHVTVQYGEDVKWPLKETILNENENGWSKYTTAGSIRVVGWCVVVHERKYVHNENSSCFAKFFETRPRISQYLIRFFSSCFAQW